LEQGLSFLEGDVVKECSLHDQRHVEVREPLKLEEVRYSEKGSVRLD
jgi:hypothetical protein